MRVSGRIKQHQTHWRAIGLCMPGTSLQARLHPHPSRDLLAQIARRPLPACACGTQVRRRGRGRFKVFQQSRSGKRLRKEAIFHAGYYFRRITTPVSEPVFPHPAVQKRVRATAHRLIGQPPGRAVTHLGPSALKNRFTMWIGRNPFSLQGHAAFFTSMNSTKFPSGSLKKTNLVVPRFKSKVIGPVTTGIPLARIAATSASRSSTRRHIRTTPILLNLGRQPSFELFVPSKPVRCARTGL